MVGAMEQPMRSILDNRFKKRSTAVGKRREQRYCSVTRQEIESAIADYLARGGKITRIEPEWIEEGEIYIAH
jgi:uncharacterized protein (DUF1330 family)